MTKSEDNYETELISVVNPQLQIHYQEQKNIIIKYEKEIIKILKECMNIIQKEIVELPDESKELLTKRTLIMWQKSNEDTQQNLEYNIKRAASYIIVDQLLFYSLLLKKKKYLLPPLKPLDIETDFISSIYEKYMQKAISITGNYKPIFNINLFDLLPNTKKIKIAINEVIDIINNLQIPIENSDFIGKIFHSMIPLEIRKEIAAYYSNSASALLLASLVIENPTEKICDLACGSGTLLVESYHVLKNLYKKNGSKLSDEELHKQIIENQIYGNDITLFASHLAAMNLAIQDLDAEVSKINITSTDGLKINPNGNISPTYNLLKYSLNNTKKEIGVQMSDSINEIIFPYFNCIIMNPPFSRSQNMNDELKMNLDNLIKIWFGNYNKKQIKQFYDKNMGLHGYFMIHADHFLKTDGKIAFILPASTFSTEYGIKLIHYFKSKNYSIEYIIEKLSNSPTFSEDCAFKEFMIVFKKNKLTPLSKTTLISIKDNFEINDVFEIVNEINSDISEGKWIIKEKINTSDVYKSKNWNNLYEKMYTLKFISDIYLFLENSGKLENYKENQSELSISSGYDSTYADYLLLPNKIWDIEKLNSNKYRLINKKLSEFDENKITEIQSNYLIKSISRSGDINSLITTSNCFTLNLPPELDNKLIDFKRKYIIFNETEIEQKFEENRKQGHKRSPIIKRPIKIITNNNSIKYKEIPWYSYPWKNHCENKVGQLFHCLKFNLSSRKNLVIYVNECVSANSNFYIISTKNDKFYASWMNSIFYFYFVILNLQKVSKGYFYLKIQDFDNIKFPKIDLFSENEIEELIQKWEDLSNIPENELRPIPLQINMDEGQIPLKERYELDKTWLKCLGVSEDKIDELIKKLYRRVTEFIKIY